MNYNEIFLKLLQYKVGQIDLKPSEKLWKPELQKELFGPFYNGNNVPFILDKGKWSITPVYSGLFEKYKDYIKDKKDYVLILGTSGTCKTFILQQEAQKTFMIYILCNVTQTNFEERDSSFSTLFTNLDILENRTEQKALNIIHIFIISRLLYLQLVLEEANLKGKELDPVDFFILQMNGNSLNTAGLFQKVLELLRENENLSQISYDLMKLILSKYSYDTVISSIGKEDAVTIYYTKEASREDHLEILNYFFNLDNVNLNELDYFLLTGKKGLSANVIRFLDVNSSNNKTEQLKISFQKSYNRTKSHLIERIHEFLDESSEETKKRFKSSIKQLIFSSFFSTSDELYTINYEGDMNIDLMNLGIVNQYKREGKTMISLTKDLLILDVCKCLYPSENIILSTIFKDFKKIIERDGIKSSTKGISFEWVILAYLLDKDLQDLPLSQLPFLKMNLPNEYPEWIDRIIFKCINFGTKYSFRNSDIEILKNMKNIILKPEDDMHPDGIMCFYDQDKYYFLNICCKISSDKVQSHHKNEMSGDMDLFYLDKYDKLKSGPGVVNWRDGKPLESINNLKRKFFFQEFSPSKIGGVVRILVELDPSNATPKIKIVKDKIEEFEVEQIIIHITMENFNTLIPKNNSMHKYFENLMNYSKNLKISQKSDGSKENK